MSLRFSPVCFTCELASQPLGVVVQLYQLPEIIKGIFSGSDTAAPSWRRGSAESVTRCPSSRGFFFLPSLWRHELLLIQLMCFTPACNEFSQRQKIMTRSRTHKLCSLFLREIVSTCVCVRMSAHAFALMQVIMRMFVYVFVCSCAGLYMCYPWVYV